MDFEKLPELSGAAVLEPDGGWVGDRFVRTRDEESGLVTVWSVEEGPDGVLLREAQMLTRTSDGELLVNGQPVPFGG